MNRCSVQTDTGLWMRPAYWQGLRNRKIFAVVRRRDRSDPKDPTFIPLDMNIPVRFIERAGFREANIQPKLYPDDGTTVQVISRIVKPIKELTALDLFGGSPDIATPELVRWHLALIDNTPLLDWDQVVTVYRLFLMPDATE